MKIEMIQLIDMPVTTEIVNSQDIQTDEDLHAACKRNIFGFYIIPSSKQGIHFERALLKMRCHLFFTSILYQFLSFPFINIKNLHLENTLIKNQGTVIKVNFIAKRR